MNPYKTLGVKKDVTDKQLHKAYLELAKQYHPDNKETGSKEKFEEIKLAYDTLKNPQTKAMYDACGFVPGWAKNPNLQEAINEIKILFRQLADQLEPEQLEQCEVIKTILSHIETNKQGLVKNNKDATKKKAKIEKQIKVIEKRMKIKKEGSKNIFLEALQNSLNETENYQHNVAHRIQLCTLITEMLGDYEYDSMKVIHSYQAMQAQQYNPASTGQAGFFTFTTGSQGPFGVW